LITLWETVASFSTHFHIIIRHTTSLGDGVYELEKALSDLTLFYGDHMELLLGCIETTLTPSKLMGKVGVL